MADWRKGARVVGSLGYNVAADLLRPRKRKFEFLKRLLTSGINYDQRLCAPSTDFWALYPEARSLRVPMEVQYLQSNVNPLELYFLSCVAILHKATRIFEIGTFDGATTLQLARSCPTSRLFTVDLRPGTIPAGPQARVEDEVRNVRANRIGSRFLGTPEANRITQLYGDSTCSDYTPYYGSMDLVFVDACHDYEFVRADTATALRLIRPGGVIFWHDYSPDTPGVKRAVEELLEKHAIVHLAYTALAMLDSRMKKLPTMSHL